MNDGQLYKWIAYAREELGLDAIEYMASPRRGFIFVRVIPVVDVRIRVKLISDDFYDYFPGEPIVFWHGELFKEGVVIGTVNAIDEMILVEF